PTKTKPLSPGCPAWIRRIVWLTARQSSFVSVRSRRKKDRLGLVRPGQRGREQTDEPMFGTSTGHDPNPRSLGIESGRGPDHVGIATRSDDAARRSGIES